MIQRQHDCLIIEDDIHNLKEPPTKEEMEKTYKWFKEHMAQTKSNGGTVWISPEPIRVSDAGGLIECLEKMIKASKRPKTIRERFKDWLIDIYNKHQAKKGVTS